VTPHQKQVLMRAAQAARTSLTHFMVEKAYQAAQEVLADQTVFLLPDEQWEAFCKALDRPPRDLPALRKLLSEPTVLDA